MKSDAVKGRSTTGTTTRSTSRAASKPRSRKVMVEIEATPPENRSIEVQIAERAYLIWCERGGDEVSNWLEAERQLRGG